MWMMMCDAVESLTVQPRMERVMMSKATEPYQVTATSFSPLSLSAYNGIMNHSAIAYKQPVKIHSQHSLLRFYSFVALRDRTIEKECPTPR